MLPPFKKDELSKFEFISFKVFFVIFFLLIVNFALVLLLFPGILSVFVQDVNSLLENLYLQTFMLISVLFLNTYMIYFFCCKRRGLSLEKGLFFSTVSKDVIIKCVLIGIIIPLIASSFLLEGTPENFKAKEILNAEGGLFLIVTTGLIFPLGEELFYRGVLFPLFQSKLNSFWAIFIVSITFGASHIFNLGDAIYLLSYFVLLSFLFTLIRYRTNSMIPSIVTHTVYNLTLLTLLLFAGG